MYEAFDELSFTEGLRDSLIPLAEKFIGSGNIESVGLIRKQKSDVQMFVNCTIAGVKLEEGLATLADFSSEKFRWPRLPPRSVLDDISQVKISGGWSSKPLADFPVDAHGLREASHCNLLWRSGDADHRGRADVRMLDRTLSEWVFKVLVPMIGWARDAAIAAPRNYGIQLQAQQFVWKESVFYDEESMWWAK